MPNAVKLPHKLDRRAMTCQAVIETPKGARSKFDHDEESGLFRLAGLLPEGMSFPLDFGFFPSTEAQDGDPLDVLVLHDEPIPTAALVAVQLIGVIEAEQTEQGNTVRNDRLLAVDCLLAPVRADHRGGAAWNDVRRSPDQVLGEPQRLEGQDLRRARRLRPGPRRRRP